MTHGFFLQMGGFVLVEGNNLKEVLTPNRLEYLHRQSLIEFPNVSEKEIKGRSKKGAIAKLVAALQIVSFIVRYAMRKKHGHATTQLELGTLTFTAFSFFLSFLWWEKPLDVNLPILVYKRNSTKAEGRYYTGLTVASIVSSKANPAKGNKLTLYQFGA
jgi:hypothetical protein